MYGRHLFPQGPFHTEVVDRGPRGLRVRGAVGEGVHIVQVLDATGEGGSGSWHAEGGSGTFSLDASTVGR